ncbi:MAG: hypothetical protein WC385_03280 [Candidatus Paceibacterota bacterium]|jgi:hypothetical protein
MKQKILITSFFLIILGASWPVSTLAADPSLTVTPSTTGAGYVYTHQGETIEVNWVASNIPTSMECIVNKNDIVGVDGLGAIQTKLLARYFAGKGYITITAKTPTWKYIKFTCYNKTNPSQIILEKDLTLAVSTGATFSPALTVTAEPATGLRLNDLTKISWSATNLPAGGSICRVDRSTPNVIAGLNPTDLDIIDRGLGKGIAGQYVYGSFSGYANLKITNPSPTTKYLRVKCDLPTGDTDINTQTEIKTTTAAPTLPNPFVYVTAEPKTDLDLAHAFTVSWETNNLPLNYKCWANDGGSGVNLQGVNVTLAKGPTSYIDYGGSHYGGAYKGSNSSARLTSATPVWKTIKFACGPTLNSDVGATMTSVSVKTAAPEPTATLTALDPTTNLKVNDIVKVKWTAANIPSTMKCVTNYAGPLANGVTGVKEINDQVVDKSGSFSGNGHLKITSTVTPPANRKIRLVCYYTADPDNYIIDSQIPMVIVPGPATPTPSITLTPTSGDMIGVKPGDRINFTWRLNNIPAQVDGLNIKCWNNAGYDPAKDIAGWAEVKTRLENKELTGSATLTISPLAVDQKRLRVMCGKYPTNWDSGLVVDSTIIFNLPATPISSINRVYDVRIEGIDLLTTPENSLWGAGLAKKVAFSFAGFQKVCPGGIPHCSEAQKKYVRKIAVNLRNPKTKVKIRLSAVLKTVGEGNGSNDYAVTIGTKIPERISKNDPAVVPYFDGYKSTIEICPVFDDGSSPVGITCGTTQIFTVLDPNDAHSPTYNLPAGQGCITGSCICVNGIRKRCGSPMQSGSGCPLNHPNYPTGVCSGVGSASEKMMATAQNAFKGTMDLIVKLFGY